MPSAAEEVRAKLTSRRAKTVDHEGVIYEIREPDIGTLTRARSFEDPFDSVVALVAACTFVGGEQLWPDGAAVKSIAAGQTQLLKALRESAMEWINAEVDAARKNSEATPSGN